MSKPTKSLSRSVLRRLRKQGKTVAQIAKLYRTTRVTLYRNFGPTLKGTKHAFYKARTR